MFRNPFFLCLFFILFFLIGCKKESVQVYTVPKEPALALPAASSTESGEKLPVTWTVPENWKTLPATGMRLAGFEILTEGKKATVSVVALEGEAGGLLANVNRWRGQIGLSPISESELSSAMKITLNGKRFVWVDLSGSQRILSAILSDGTKTWFFKMMGDTTVIESQIDAFKTFLASVKF